MDINETQVIHMTSSKLAADLLPAYAPDDGPLTANQVRALRADADGRLPKGKLFAKEALLS